MDSLQRLMEISSRLDHLEESAEWIAKETVHTDNAISQTSTLITVLAEDIREKVCELVHVLEQVSESVEEEDLEFH